MRSNEISQIRQNFLKSKNRCCSYILLQSYVSAVELSPQGSILVSSIGVRTVSVKMDDADRYKKNNQLTLVCQEEAFAVDKSIACDKSRVLETACNSKYQEGLTKTIQVNFDKETLQRMIDFMLRGKYDGPGLDAVPAPSPVCENETDQEPEANLEEKVAAVEITEVSSIEDDSDFMFNMLRPHILVNAIADYYQVDGLKKQANDNIRRILRFSWSANGIVPAVELAFASSADTELCTIMATAVGDHMTDLIAREDFTKHKLFNQFSIGVIQELFKKLMVSQHKLMQTEQKVCDMMVEGKNEVDSLKQKVSDLEVRISNCRKRCYRT